LPARYGAAPQALEDVLILTPTAKVDERRREYPRITVLPIAFAASELQASHWKFLMGAVGSQSLYIRQLALIMKKLRGALTLDALREGIEQSTLSDYLKDLALLRLKFAAEYIDDVCRLTDVLRPGRLVIVDLEVTFSQAVRDQVLPHAFQKLTSALAFSTGFLFGVGNEHVVVRRQTLVRSLDEMVRPQRLDPARANEMQSEHPFDPGMAGCRDTVHEQRRLGGVHDRVVRPGYGIGVTSLTHQDFGRAQRFGRAAPLGDHHLPLHSTATASRSTAS